MACFRTLTPGIVGYKNSEEFELIIESYFPNIHELACATWEFIFNCIPCSSPSFFIIVIWDKVPLTLSYYGPNYLHL